MKQIVISVPEEWLEGTPPNLYDVMGAVMNGTVLPEHHGDLIDKSEITAFAELECNGHDVKSLDEFTTIIPETKEGDGKCKWQ